MFLSSIALRIVSLLARVQSWASLCESPRFMSCNANSVRGGGFRLLCRSCTNRFSPSSNGWEPITTSRRIRCIEACLGMVLGHVQHTGPLQVIQQREVFVPFPKRFLVHSQLRQKLSSTPSHASLPSSLHDPVNLVPARSQLLVHRFLARHPQPVNHQPFHQSREPAR